MYSRPEGGATLIELLISITIVAVVLVIIMGAFRIGIRAWETGERDVELFQREQIVLSILKRQLASACRRPIPVEGEQPFIFKGTEEEIDFVSTVSVVPGENIGDVRVTYRVGRNHDSDLFSLEIAERDLLTGDRDKPMDLLDDDMIHELVTGVYAIKFAYLKQGEDGDREWLPEWADANEVGLPAAVKCSLQMDEKKPPVSIVARILTEADTR